MYDRCCVLSRFRHLKYACNNVLHLCSTQPWSFNHDVSQGVSAITPKYLYCWNGRSEIVLLFLTVMKTSYMRSFQPLGVRSSTKEARSIHFAMFQHLLCDGSQSRSGSFDSNFLGLLSHLRCIQYLSGSVPTLPDPLCDVPTSQSGEIHFSMDGRHSTSCRIW